MNGAFRHFLKAGTGWPVIEARDDGKPAPPRPDLPYVSVLLMDTRQMGIPYRYSRGVTDPAEADYGNVQAREVGVAAHVMNLYSVQFHGPEAFYMGTRMTLWVRSDAAHLWRTNPVQEIKDENGNTLRDKDGQVQYRGSFYVHDCTRVTRVSSVVNGVWEERAVVNMQVEERIYLDEPRELEDGEGPGTLETVKVYAAGPDQVVPTVPDRSPDRIPPDDPYDLDDLPEPDEPPALEVMRDGS